MKNNRSAVVSVRMSQRCGLLAKLISAAALGAVSGQACALSFEYENGVKWDLDTTLRYSAAWRVEGQNDTLLKESKYINADDGNRNLDTGLVKNRFDVLIESDLNYGEFGAFARARAYYDDVYSEHTDNDSAATSNGVSHSFREFSDDTRDFMGKKAELLDAYLYGNFDINDRSLNVRVGRQVVSWGESLFLQGGISSAMAPLDASQANVPGVELKELFLPTGQVFMQYDLTDTLSFSAYYQYEWDKTRFDEAGSYFSTTDMLDEAGESIIVGYSNPALPGITVPAGLRLVRGSDNEPSDNGQFGIALRYLAEELNDTEFGFYYINYHDKTPTVRNTLFPLGPQLGFVQIPGIPSDPVVSNVLPGLVGKSPTPANAVVVGEYSLDYVENINLYGASFGTVVGETNISGEVSYRVNNPISVTREVAGTAVTEMTLADTIQYQVSVVQLLGANTLMDNLSLSAEIGANQILGYSSRELGAPGVHGASDKDNRAWGGSITLTPSYYGVLPGFDLDVPVSVSTGFNGNSPIIGTFTEGATKASISTRLTYKNLYQAQLTYVGFYGDPQDSQVTDRDFVGVSLKYSF
ncbi:TPA: DUF1302 domain-containing protein [Pseudomonas aeruginosa]